MTSRNADDQPTDDEVLDTVADLARQWHLGESSVRRYIKEGELRATRIGRSVRVPRRASRAFLAQMQAAGLNRASPPPEAEPASPIRAPDRPAAERQAPDGHPSESQQRATQHASEQQTNPAAPNHKEQQ